VAFKEDVIQQLLPNGVVHFAGTAHPGEHGMVAITGHSSNYPWIKGDYNTIFATLPKTKAGEQIALQYNNQTYLYVVRSTYQVDPTNLSVLGAGKFDGLRLITCYPIGTSLRRFVVEAEQISPNPASNTAFTAATFSGTMPGK